MCKALWYSFFCFRHGHLKLTVTGDIIKYERGGGEGGRGERERQLEWSELDNCLLRPLVRRWSQRNQGWGRFQHVFFKDVFKPFHIIGNSLINSLQSHQVGMYGLGSLLSHDPETHVPPFKPGDDVVFQNVHFWEDGRVGKGDSINSKKLFMSCSVKISYMNT